MSEDATVLEVAVVGAGFSGICAGIKLLDAGIRDFRIFEKSPGIGGTWWENTYPGAACDVASHLYCFSFEPNPDWSRKYSPRPEIQAYLAHCVDKYGLRDHLSNGMHLQQLRFDDVRKLWTLHFANGERAEAHHVILGTGGLHLPTLPDIPGIESFKGRWMHSAQWQKGFTLNGLRVALVGSAASAIQILPAIAARVARIEMFQRTPNYIMPRRDRSYGAREKWAFRHIPGLLKLYRLFLFLRMELLLFPITREHSNLRRRAREMAIAFMRREVRDPALHAALTPDYEMGCKRILIADDFYAALNHDNVALVTTPIAAIEEQGVRTADGVLHGADLIVYATGFDLERHLHGVEILGPGGRSLDAQWADIAEAYNGCCVPGFPNLWFTTGPNTAVGTTSVVFMIEQEVRYILGCIRSAGRERLMTVSERATRAYNDTIQAALQHTVWASGCKSWYRRADGRIATLYPWNAMRFRRQLARRVEGDFALTRK
jgi:cation diffusion facilitator CzcD-associated flavoprotein CzcO